MRYIPDNKAGLGVMCSIFTSDKNQVLPLSMPMPMIAGRRFRNKVSKKKNKRRLGRMTTSVRLVQFLS